MHLDVTLVMEVQLTEVHCGEAERQALAQRVAHELAGMRLAGGSVMPACPGPTRQARRPVLDLVPDDSQHEAQRAQFRRLARRLMPGFALVSRDDLLQARLAELLPDNPNATLLEAWLDLSRWNSHAENRPAKAGNDQAPTVEWVTDTRPGWTVPMPVGFAALSELQVPGSVSGARDMRVPFRFVETVWSIGQWISPHRLKRLRDLVWRPDHDSDQPGGYGLYRCHNEYRAPAPRADPAELADRTQH